MFRCYSQFHRFLLWAHLPADNMGTAAHWHLKHNMFTQGMSYDRRVTIKLPSLVFTDGVDYSTDVSRGM